MWRKGKKFIFSPKDRPYLVVYKTYDSGSSELHVKMLSQFRSKAEKTVTDNIGSSAQFIRFETLKEIIF